MRIENLLGPNHYGFVKSKIDTPTTVWYYSETTANYFDKKEPYHSSFGHLVYKKDQGALSELFDSFDSRVESASEINSLQWLVSAFVILFFLLICR